MPDVKFTISIVNEVSSFIHFVFCCCDSQRMLEDKGNLSDEKKCWQRLLDVAEGGGDSSANPRERSINWSHFEEVVGTTYPEGYKVFFDYFPRVLVGTNAFDSPATTEEFFYDVAKAIVLEYKKDFVNLAFPENYPLFLNSGDSGFMPVMCYGGWALGFQVDGGKGLDKWAIYCCEFEEFYHLEGGFCHVLCFLLFDDRSIERKDDAVGVAALDLRFDPADFIIVKMSPETKAHRSKYFFSLSEEERKMISLEQQ